MDTGVAKNMRNHSRSGGTTLVTARGEARSQKWMPGHHMQGGVH